MAQEFIYKVLSEMPGTPSQVFYIPSGTPGVGRDGVMIEYSPKNDSPWIGVYAFGDTFSSDCSGVYPGPGKNLLTIVAKGSAYIASPDDPQMFYSVKSCPVIRAIPVPDRDLMLFHDYTEIVAYGANGLVWSSRRISWDGIIIDHIEEDSLIGRSWDSPNDCHVEFRVDLATGLCQGGASPPEYDSLTT